MLAPPDAVNSGAAAKRPPPLGPLVILKADAHGVRSYRVASARSSACGGPRMDRSMEGDRPVGNRTRTASALAIAAGALVLAWFLRSVVLLAFTGVLLGVLLDWIATL